MSTTIRINEFFVTNLWRWKCDVSETASLDKLPPGSIKDISEIMLPDNFDEIIELANNRMMQGQFRYGLHSLKTWNRYDTVKQTYKRMKRYEEDGNLEHLTDALNMIRIEYYKAKHAGKRLISIDDGHHAKPEKS